MPRTVDSRPRHEQIAADIRAQIMSGDLTPGDQLPSTPNLVIKYSAANATIQSALRALKDEGFLYSHVGKGVYVSERRSLAVEVAPYLDPAPGRYSYQLLRVAEIEPPNEIRQALELVNGELVVMRHRLLRYAGDPVELSWSYYPAPIARGTELAKRGKITGGSPRVLAELGYVQSRLVDRVSSRMPTTEELVQLDLPINVPITRQLRTILTADGRPLEASVLVKGGHMAALLYRQAINII